MQIYAHLLTYYYSILQVAQLLGQTLSDLKLSGAIQKEILLAPFYLLVFTDLPVSPCHRVCRCGRPYVIDENICTGLISFKIEMFVPLAAQGTPNILRHTQISNASILVLSLERGIGENRRDQCVDKVFLVIFRPHYFVNCSTWRNTLFKFCIRFRTHRNRIYGALNQVCNMNRLALAPFVSIDHHYLVLVHVYFKSIFSANFF